MSDSINDNTGEDALMPRRRDLAHRMAGQEALVRDAERAMVHFINPTAVVIYECCDGATTFAGCEARIRDAFEVPAGTDLAQDIREAIADFQNKGLLE